LFLQLAPHPAWSTYPAGMTDNKCGINQSINQYPIYTRQN
jgi:hypothetical protein